MEKTKNLYYIYHIPGKKIGMTRNIYNRVIKCQGYKPGEFQILESSYDKEFIENKEHQWQEFFKYKKDFASYDNAEKSPINQFKSNKNAAALLKPILYPTKKLACLENLVRLSLFFRYISSNTVQYIL